MTPWYILPAVPVPLSQGCKLPRQRLIRASLVAPFELRLEAELPESHRLCRVTVVCSAVLGRPP
jgi:hypothetical protein